MLSVIILAGATDSPARAETVVRTLAPLVQAAVRGLVRDVVLAGTPGGELALIADHAGCAFVEKEAEADTLRAALGAVRGEAIMLLKAGHIPETGLFDEIEDLLAAGLGQGRGGFLLRAAPETFIERLMPGFAPVAGVIAPRALCKEICTGKGALAWPQLLAALRPHRTLRRRLRRIL